MKNITKPLPQNNEAEKAVLGSVLIENSVINQVMEILKPEDFYGESHIKIYNCMIDLDSESRPIDVLTLYEYMENKGNILEEVGGSAYLTYLTEIVPTASNVEHYARIVKDKAILRQLVLAATDIAHRGYEQPDNVDEYIDRAELEILNIADSKIKKSFFPTRELAEQALELVEQLHERKELITGVSTGFQRLDQMTSGLQPSDLIIIAARPGVGKTSFCLNLASHAAIKGKLSIGFFSLEMTKEQLMLRLLSIKAKVDFSTIRSGYTTDEQLKSLYKAAEEYSNADIYIDDTPALTVLEVRAKARRLYRDKGVDLIIVDYLQLMRGSSSRTESREREIAEISGSLKALAKELGVPVIGISQLSRQTEARSDRRPQLSDLRESGAIEQDADVVMFIHRPDVYRKDPEEKDGIAEIIIGKQRNGPVGTAKLAFLDQRGVPSFENLAEDFEEGIA